MIYFRLRRFPVESAALHYANGAIEEFFSCFYAFNVFSWNCVTAVLMRTTMPTHIKTFPELDGHKSISSTQSEIFLLDRPRVC